MPKKKSRISNHQQPKAKWLYEDKMELLAWLDFTKAHDISFDDTVVGHLSNVGSMDFTLTQINNKLHSLWKAHGVNETKDFDVRGSSCIKLVADEEADIAAILVRLEDRPHHLASRRFLRSTDKYRPERHTTLGAAAPLTPRKNRKPQSQIRTPKKRKIEFLESEICEETEREGTEGDTVTLFSDQATIQVDSRQTQVIGISNNDDESHVRLPVVRDSEDSASNACENDGLRKKVETTTRDKTKYDGLGAETDEEELMEGSLHPETAQKWRYLTEKKEYETRIRDLEHQLLESEEGKKDLQDKIRGLRSAHSQLQDAGDNSLEDIILMKDDHIAHLNKELNRRIERGIFTKSSGTHFTPRSVDNIEKSMNQIGDQVKQMLFSYDEDESFFVPKIKKGSDLETFVVRGLCVEPHNVRDVDCLTQRLNELEPLAVVRALVGSVLRDWVFETSFPDFTKDITPLLTKYRENLGAQDGPFTLRNLDLASHHSLIHDPQFQNYAVPTKAERFAKRLSKVLAPFFPRDPFESVKNDFETWGQGEDVWNERKSRCIKIFELALKLKADSLLNTEDYEIVIYPPGTPFDRNTMEVETKEGARAAPPKIGQGIVDLCVHASLQAYMRDELTDLDEPSKALVRYDNFIKKEDGQRSGATVITKAVVILKDESKES